MVLSEQPALIQEAFMAHITGALSPGARLKLARLIVDQGWTCTAAAQQFMISARTASKRDCCTNR